LQAGKGRKANCGAKTFSIPRIRQKGHRYGDRAEFATWGIEALGGGEGKRQQREPEERRKIAWKTGTL